MDETVRNVPESKKAVKDGFWLVTGHVVKGQR
jgi:hypothetical protein